MNAVHRSIQPDAIGGMLAAIGSAFIGVGAVQTAGSPATYLFLPGPTEHPHRSRKLRRPAERSRP